MFGNCTVYPTMVKALDLRVSRLDVVIGDLFRMKAWRVYDWVYCSRQWTGFCLPIRFNQWLQSSDSLSVSGESLRELVRGQPVFPLLVLMISAMRCKIMCEDGHKIRKKWQKGTSRRTWNWNCAFKTHLKHSKGTLILNGSRIKHSVVSIFFRIQCDLDSE